MIKVWNLTRYPILRYYCCCFTFYYWLLFSFTPLSSLGNHLYFNVVLISSIPTLSECLQWRTIFLIIPIINFQLNINEVSHKAKVAYTTADTLIWQLLASVAIPGFTINRVCAVSNYVIKKSEFLPKKSRRWAVTAVGLAAIPFIIKPIDKLVDYVLDESLRKFQPKWW